jgi:hypothetical protein
MKANRIQIVNGGRFFSYHDQGITYFDSRHRVTKNRLEGGMMGELVEELQPEDIFTSSDWPKRSYRCQLEIVNGNEGINVIEFEPGVGAEKRNRCSPVNCPKDADPATMNSIYLSTNTSDVPLSSFNGDVSIWPLASSVVSAGSAKDKSRAFRATMRRLLGGLLSPHSARGLEFHCPFSVAFTPSGPLVYRW